MILISKNQPYLDNGEISIESHYVEQVNGTQYRVIEINHGGYFKKIEVPIRVPLEIALAQEGYELLEKEY